jgi:hypothetical protein
MHLDEVEVLHRRLQMDNVRQERRHVAVPLDVLAGEPTEDVVREIDPVLLAPAQELDVADAGCVLVHQHEQLGRERLDPGLDGGHPRLLHQEDLLLRQIRARLVEALDVEIELLEAREDLAPSTAAVPRDCA